jgi:hypothetical protein
VGQTYEEWAAANITGGAAAAKTDDPDSDGFVNLLEFSLSTDPIAYPRNVNGHRNTVRMAGGIRCQVMGRELMERISH